MDIYLGLERGRFLALILELDALCQALFTQFSPAWWWLARVVYYVCVIGKMGTVNRHDPLTIPSTHGLWAWLRPRRCRQDR